MEQTGYWQQFISTGKIEDYLRYAQSGTGALCVVKKEEDGNPVKTGTGVLRNAGVHLADGDGVKADACRRI